MPYYYYLQEYNHFDFLDRILEYFDDEVCLLCGRKHKAEFYCFVPRKSFILYGDFLKAIKIKCEDNHKINIKTGSKLPYTLTILPAFIQPYARKSTDIIINAIDGHINNPAQTKIESAIRLGVENTSSFNLYFNRIVNRIDDWSINILQKISEVSGINDYERRPFESNNINQKWNYFICLADKYCDVIEELKSRVLLLKKNRMVFIFALLGMNLKCLGP